MLVTGTQGSGGGTGPWSFVGYGGGEYPLDLIGLTVGWNPDGTPVIEPLSLGEVGAPAEPLVPLAPALTGSMPTRSSVSYAWVAADNTGRPAVTGWVVQRRLNGGTWAAVTGSPFSASTTSGSQTGLATATPENVWEYRVAAVNADGQGEWSNVLGLQWATVVVQQPTAPTDLSLTGKTTTTRSLAWQLTADTSVTKQGIFEGGALRVDNIAATATEHTWTGLVAGSSHSNVTVARYNSAGWSPMSNAVSFTQPTSDTGSTIAHAPATGIPNNDEASTTHFAHWDAVRTYNYSSAIGDFNKWTPSVLALTNKVTDKDGIIHGTDDGTRAAVVLENALEDFYYGTGSANRKTCEWHVAIGNEVDRDFDSGALPTRYITAYSKYRQVIWKRNADGTRRYPNASVWVDLTQHQIDVGGSGPRFKAIARFLDGFGCSMYPTGRRWAVSGKYDDGPKFTPYNDYMSYVWTTIQDWRASGGAGGASLVGQLDSFGTWEYGIPIDHCQHGTTMTFPNGEPTAQTNFTIRPRYSAGGRDSSGKDWGGGFLGYIYDNCDRIGVKMREQIYWNQQSNVEIPNRLIHDYSPNPRTPSARANPSTEKAWHDWTPGSRLANG